MRMIRNVEAIVKCNMAGKRLILCGLVLAWCSESQSQSNFFVASNYANSNNYFCVTNTSFALSWVHEDYKSTPHQRSRYVPEATEFDNKCDISDSDITNRFCTLRYFIKQSWSLEYDFSEIILDERWEDLVIHRTSTVVGPYRPTIREPVLPIRKPNFAVAFSVQIEKEGHIFLCDGQVNFGSNCYWFILQGFNGGESGIRKYDRGEISFFTNIYDIERCSHQSKSIQHPEWPPYLSSSRWSHFVVSKQDDLLTFSSYAGNKTSKILEWRDAGTPIEVTHMTVHSNMVNGLWKIHALDFLYTQRKQRDGLELGPPIRAIKGIVCISMYIRMCEACKIKLTLTAEETEAINETTYENMGSDWNRIKFITNNVSNAIEFRLLVATISESNTPYWQINKFRTCRPEEFRMIALPRKATCQLMSGTSNIITFEEKEAVSRTTCPEDTIGPFCVKCDSIFDDCKQIKICTEEQCVCSAGSYNGCYDECPGRRYGHGCRKSCESCQYSCNSIDGTCDASTCRDNDYSGPGCDIQSSIMFAKPPNVTAITYYTATVTVTDFETAKPIDDNEPQYYRIQYKKSQPSNSSWIDYKTPFTFLFKEPASVKIENLNPETKYLVRSVVVSTSGTLQTGEEVKFTEFTTSCQEITDDNIAIKAYMTNVVVSFVQTENFTCKSYTVSLEEVSYRGFLSKGVTYFTNLKPSTRYTLRVQGENTTFKKQFMTEPEDISEAPYDLRLDWTLTNDLVVEWKYPTRPNDKINHFNISIAHLLNPSSILTKQLHLPNGADNLTYYCNVSASELTPTTQYKITVFAFDGVNVSAITTSPPAIPSIEEEPRRQISNHTIELTIIPKTLQGETDYYRIIVLRSDKESNVNSYPELKDFDLSNLRIVIECNSTNTDLFLLILGGRQPLVSCRDIDNSPLEPATSYNVTIILTNTYSGKTRSKVYSMVFQTTGKINGTGANSALFALLVLLIIPVIVFCYIKRKSTWSFRRQVLALNSIGEGNVRQRTDQMHLVEIEPKLKKNVLNTNTVQLLKNAKDLSKLVSVKQFENYFKAALQNQQLKQQYENILETVLTYETVIGDNLRSDYVDMNFNSGVQIKKAYIITKLPEVAEFNEFWKTVEDENVYHIILFEHLHPNQKKSRNYWPDVGNSVRCGDIIIECNTCQKYAFYTHRQFSLKCQNEIRKIDQLHFSLPSKDNRYLSSLNYVQFFQEMLKIPQSCRSPILVHSSAGMRGISFALLCDMSLRTVQKDGSIDVMANFRMLVQTTTEMKIEFDHYVAAHAIVADTLSRMDTSFPCSSFDGTESNLFTKEETQKHLHYLRDTLWLDGIIIEEEQGCYVNCPTILLKSEQQVVLHAVSGNRSQMERPDFIKVGGFKTPGKFWVAKRPVSTPLSDFLEKVQAKKISVIATLNDNIFTWPSEDQPEIVLSNDVTLKFKFIKTLRSYDWITLELTTKATSQIVEIVTLRNWSAPVAALPKIADFVEFVTESSEIFQNVEPVLVTCHDGVTSCGLYLAMWSIIQQIKTESVCDVCMSIRRLRRHCQDFVKDDKQYVFLLEAAHHYMKQFTLYEVR